MPSRTTGCLMGTDIEVGRDGGSGVGIDALRSSVGTRVLLSAAMTLQPAVATSRPLSCQGRPAAGMHRWRS
jgi:hypothetical protein